mmetsp:Transcript_69898/g.221441  ORF Transcript_69898/g.221441 Transcript_69898/m.221441 type:complete len:210 (+) Transcript_69898:780-1409(+)
MEQLAVLPHRHAHLPLRHPVGAGEVHLEHVQLGFARLVRVLAPYHPVGAGEVHLEHVHAHLLAAADQLLPGVLVVFLHNRGDQHAVGVLVLEPFELFQHHLQGTVRDELDVLPPDDLLVVALGAELGVARGDIDDLGGIEGHGLCDDTAPPVVKGLLHNLVVGAGGPAADDEGIGEVDTVHRHAEVRAAGNLAVDQLHKGAELGLVALL